MNKLMHGMVLALASASLLSATTAPAAAGNFDQAPYRGKIVKRDGLAARQGPSTRYRVVKSVPNNAVVSIACKVNGQVIGGNPRWYRLADSTYVTARYVSIFGAQPKWCGADTPSPTNSEPQNNGGLLSQTTNLETGIGI